MAQYFLLGGRSNSLNIIELAMYLRLASFGFVVGDSKSVNLVLYVGQQSEHLARHRHTDLHLFDFHAP